jgi:hypothetical protein
MLDLGAIEARAEAATLAFVDLKRWQGSNLPPLANLIKDTAIELAATAADVPTLVAELRAAREVVEAASGFSAFMNEDAEDLQWPDEQLTDLAAALAAYRAVVGGA